MSTDPIPALRQQALQSYAEHLDALMMEAVAAAEFPPEERPAPEPYTPTPEQEAAYLARTRSGYYLPDAGAFDLHEGPLAHADFTRPATIDRPFHIGQAYDHAPALMLACGHCGGTLFEVGAGHCYTALRCTFCQREWCQHEG